MQPAATFPATDSKQFYVSVSRGRECYHIYTDDKEMLLRRASELGERQSAIELVGGHQKYQQLVQQHQRPYHLKALAQQGKKIKSKQRDYEPDIKV